MNKKQINIYELYQQYPLVRRPNESISSWVMRTEGKKYIKIWTILSIFYIFVLIIIVWSIL